MSAVRKLAALLGAVALLAAAWGDSGEAPATGAAPGLVATTEATPQSAPVESGDQTAAPEEEAITPVTGDDYEDEEYEDDEYEDEVDRLREELELAKEKDLNPPATALPPATEPTPGDRDLPTIEGDIPAGFESLVTTAAADLAARTPDDAGPITVVSTEFVVWPDSSLGCPQPGMSYLQVQVEGAKVVLERAGIEYPYHSDGSRTFLCS